LRRDRRYEDGWVIAIPYRQNDHAGAFLYRLVSPSVGFVRPEIAIRYNVARSWPTLSG